MVNFETYGIVLDGIILTQGTNGRKVISEVYSFCVLQFTVFGRKSKHKTVVTAWHEIHFQKIIYEIFW